MFVKITGTKLAVSEVLLSSPKTGPRPTCSPQPRKMCENPGGDGLISSKLNSYSYINKIILKISKYSGPVQSYVPVFQIKIHHFGKGRGNPSGIPVLDNVSIMLKKQFVKNLFILSLFSNQIGITNKY